MDAQKQIIERLKQAHNVLLTVSNNPTVDQLAALIGLSLLLGKLDKHATAVYSGETPSTIEFLQPENTIEKTTDSLRDFIISLDKSKADKLRYKVEDSVVRIFITPYRTSITDADLEFSQGDFNIDVIVALGVHQQQDLDQAITAHGRILHDATVMTINNMMVAELGAINWLNETASSISEMVTVIAVALGKDLLDEQIATALLTGIVAETDRFSNSKTSANTMKASAVLMGAGANQQLVATQLQAVPDDALPADEPESTASPLVDDEQLSPETPTPEMPPPHQDDGTLQISHDDDPPRPAPAPTLIADSPPDEADRVDETDKTDASDEPADAAEARLAPIDEPANAATDAATPNTPHMPEMPDTPLATGSTPAKLNDTPPELKDTTTRHVLEGASTLPPPEAATKDGEAEEFVEEMTLPAVVDSTNTPILTHTNHLLGDQAPTDEQPAQSSGLDLLDTAERASNQPTIIRPSEPPAYSYQTAATNQSATPAAHTTDTTYSQGFEELDLKKLQRPANLPSDQRASASSLDPSLAAARDAVQQATFDVPEPPKPAVALNAQPLGDRLHEPVAPLPAPTVPTMPAMPATLSPAQPPQAQPIAPPLQPPQPTTPPAPFPQASPTPHAAAVSESAAPSVPPPILPFPSA